MNNKIKAQYDIEVERLAERIISKYRPDKIFIFGSYAKNKITLDSDVDFFIVKNTKKPARKGIEKFLACYWTDRFQLIY